MAEENKFIEFMNDEGHEICIRIRDIRMVESISASAVVFIDRGENRGTSSIQGVKHEVGEWIKKELGILK